MFDNNISILDDENATEALLCPGATDAELYQLLYANWLLNGCIQLVLCVAGECEQKIFAKYLLEDFV